MWSRLKSQGWFRRIPKGGGLIGGIVVAVIVIIWLLTGIYTVGPGSVGVIQQFGKRLPSTTGPGLHYRLPWPIQRVTAINMEEIRRAEIGFRTVAVDPQAVFQAVPAEESMLTGDKNIVNVRITVQYRVKNAADFLFNVRDVEGTLHTATEVALRDAVGNIPIDEVILTPAPVLESTRAFLQRLLDTYRAGVQITEVKLNVAGPPREVKDSFDEVVRALEDKSKLEREAEGYLADVVPRAEGDKLKKIAEAQGYKAQVLAQAAGEAARFLSILEEYREAPEVTRRRLYLETMEKVLPGVEKIVIDPQGTGGVIPFLPLRDLGLPLPTPTPAPLAGGK